MSMLANHYRQSSCIYCPEVPQAWPHKRGPSCSPIVFTLSCFHYKVACAHQVISASLDKTERKASLHRKHRCVYRQII